MFNDTVIIRHPDTWRETCEHLVRDFLTEGSHFKVNTGHWQSVKGTSHSQTREIMHLKMTLAIQPTPGSWAAMIRPNLPWAEDHFQERVGGEPLNPGEQYKNWPWYAGGVEDHKESGKFSHTYMERFWPRQAGGSRAIGMPSLSEWDNRGIYYRYGDLNDLVELLWREPTTRQAYLPVWFPEDTGAHHGERVPCTLGYHFMLREDRLHCFYPMRSVDFVRYLRDDLYMAGRLVQWVILKLRKKSMMKWQADPDAQPFWEPIVPGNLEFFASSLHIFEGDVPKLEREHVQTNA